MATITPSPNTSPSAVPPTSDTTSTPPPEPPSTITPSSQPKLGSPESSNQTTQSPPPVVPSVPPPTAPSTPSTPPPNPQSASPPSSSNVPPPTSDSSPPPSSNAPPTTPGSPPPPSTNRPKSSPSPLPPASDPPASSPPPPAAKPPENSPPPPPNPPETSPPSPSSKPPENSPPPPPPSLKPPETSPPPPLSKPPEKSPPPPSSNPPETSPPPPLSKPPEKSPPPPSSNPPETSPPPPPSSNPPENSPPPPAAVPPKSSPPPPASTPPRSSPPPPASISPSNAPPPPRLTPPTPPGSQPTPSSPNFPPKSSPPPPKIRQAPPPPSPASPPAPSQIPSPPTSNTSSSNAPESSNAKGNGGIGTGGAVAISVVVGVIVLSLIGLGVWCMRKRRKKISGFEGYAITSPPDSSPRSDSAFLKIHSSALLVGSRSGSDFVNSPPEPAGVGNSRPWFTFEELAKATNGFAAQNLLGEGGFGCVYKGCLPDGREVAVKQLKIGGGQGEREFKAEVEIISRIHHRHLVSLVGYCISENGRLLVYEYVANDTLYFHLHEGRPVLDWATRVKVAAGAGRGIAYLHEDCHPRIIHRDIKSSNILLDNNFEARVSDFGLAKLALDANTHISTRVMGTFGYLAPEYASSGKLTEKSDVYSYGVVLLELITGRKPVDTSQPLGDESLVEWARPLLSYALDNEEFEGVVDPRLEKNYVESEMFRMIEIAAACVRHSSAKRPRMGQVVRAFGSLATSDLTNGMRVGESELFNSAQQSAEIRLFRMMAFGSQNYSTDFLSEEV